MSKFDSINSGSRVTLKWVESLPAELKNQILYRFYKAATSETCLEELSALNQELYEMIQSGTKIPTTESTAKKTDRPDGVA